MIPTLFNHHLCTCIYIQIHTINYLWQKLKFKYNLVAKARKLRILKLKNHSRRFSDKCLHQEAENEINRGCNSINRKAWNFFLSNCCDYFSFNNYYIGMHFYVSKRTNWCNSNSMLRLKIRLARNSRVWFEFVIFFFFYYTDTQLPTMHRVPDILPVCTGTHTLRAPSGIVNVFQKTCVYIIQEKKEI